MTIRTAIAAAAAAIALGGCMTLPDTHPLTATEWRLTTIAAAGGTTNLDAAMQARHRLSLREEGALEVQLDCNRGRGTWTAGQPRSGAGAISIGPLASTRMACPEPGHGSQMGSGLAEAQRFALGPDRGTLVIEGPSLRLTFERAD